MAYWAVGVLAIIINLIINHDLFFPAKGEELTLARRAYRNFLFAITAYYITDAVWGVLDELHLVTLLIIDTYLYFLAVANAVFEWTQYVRKYLGEKSRFERILFYAGRLFFLFELICLTVNIFVPILFRIDSDGVYHAEFMRYVGLFAQILLFLLSFLYCLSFSYSRKDGERGRHLTIGWFGLAMALLLTVQLFFPLLPIYSIGYMIGSCVLHSFVVESEKREYHKALEESLDRERRKEVELGSAKRLAYTDPLTGVRSKLAYVEDERTMNELIADRSVKHFAVGVFDLNGLKRVNDTLGHDVGDLYIRNACKLICDCFTHSPVYRVGGDEFTVVLKERDFEERHELFRAFDANMEENVKNKQTVVASGFADFDPASDKELKTVFERADERMYTRKRFLKRLGASTVND